MPLRRLRRAVLAGAAALCLLPAAPAAAAPVFFHLPSRNIGCVLDGASLRCDVNRTSTPAPPRPAGCDLDYGNAFGLRRFGRAHRLCVGDTVVDPRSPVLRYGRTFSRGGFR